MKIYRDDSGIKCSLSSVTSIEVKEDYPIDKWSSPKAFEIAGIKGYEPMTAKELDTEDSQDECLDSEDYFLEEKFDGTRALMYFLPTEKELSLDDYEEDEYILRSVLKGGSNVVNGKVRIYEHFTKCGEDNAKFLAKEYGDGGYCGSTILNYKLKVMHDSKGLWITVDNFECVYPWNKVASVIEDMIAKGEYKPFSSCVRCFSRRISKRQTSM